MEIVNSIDIKAGQKRVYKSERLKDCSFNGSIVTVLRVLCSPVQIPSISSLWICDVDGVEYAFIAKEIVSLVVADTVISN